jgi:hypothetical protein
VARSFSVNRNCGRIAKRDDITRAVSGKVYRLYWFLILRFTQNFRVAGPRRQARVELSGYLEEMEGTQPGVSAPLLDAAGGIVHFIWERATLLSQEWLTHACGRRFDQVRRLH